jgi:hypothetical protein
MHRTLRLPPRHLNRSNSSLQHQHFLFLSPHNHLGRSLLFPLLPQFRRPLCQSQRCDWSSCCCWVGCCDSRGDGARGGRSDYEVCELEVGVLDQVSVFGRRSLRWDILLMCYSGPIAAVAVAIFLLTWPTEAMMEQPVRRSWRQLDFLGSFLLIAASVLVVFAFQQAGLRPHSWDTAMFLAPLLVGCVCWCILFAWEILASHHSIATILPPRLLKRRVYTSTVIVTILTGFVNFTAIYSLPLHFQIVNGTSPLTAGVGLLPLLVSAAIGSMLGGLTATHSFPALAIANGLIALGTGLLSTLSTHHGIQPKTYGFEVPLGLGIGLSISTSTLLAALQCGLGDLASAQGIVAQARVLGGSIGIAASSAVLGGMGVKAGRLGMVVDEREVYAKAFRETMWICAVVGCIALVASVGTYEKGQGKMSQSSAGADGNTPTRQEIVVEKVV